MDNGERGSGIKYYPDPEGKDETNPQGSIRVSFRYTPLISLSQDKSLVDESGLEDSVQFDVNGMPIRGYKKTKKMLEGEENKEVVLRQAEEFYNQLTQELDKQSTLPRVIRQIFGKSYSQHKSWKKGEDSKPGVIHIKVLRARDLLPSDEGTQTSDPFVAMHVDPESMFMPTPPSASSSAIDMMNHKRTATKQRTLQPTWNEGFSWGIADLRYCSLILEVMDEDKFVSAYGVEKQTSEYLGQVKLEMADLLNLYEERERSMDEISRTGRKTRQPLRYTHSFPLLPNKVGQVMIIYLFKKK